VAANTWQPKIQPSEGERSEPEARSANGLGPKKAGPAVVGRSVTIELAPYTVARRTQEIGVRMSLGAQRGDISRLVLAEGGRLVGAGLVRGIALALGRGMSGLLFGVSAADPVTFAAVPLELAAVALLAIALPARRATQVEVSVALRSEQRRGPAGGRSLIQGVRGFALFLTDGPFASLAAARAAHQPTTSCAFEIEQSFPRRG
jgi:hypothetical protein